LILQQSNPSLKEVIVVPYGKIFYLVSPQGELFKKFDSTPDVYEFSAKGELLYQIWIYKGNLLS
jgi:hypothetical protein